MKNIEHFIIEQEYKRNFLVQEGVFMDWLKKLGKKFWDWLFDKDIEFDEKNCSTGEKIRWIPCKGEDMTKMLDNEQIKQNFPTTARMWDKRYTNLAYVGTNKDSVPVIFAVCGTVNEYVVDRVRKSSANYDKFVDRVNNIEHPVILVSLEIAKKNNEDVEDIFDKHVYDFIDNILCKQYDIVFLDADNLRNYLKMLKWEYNIDLKMALIDGQVEWKDIPNTPTTKSKTETTTTTTNNAPNTPNEPDDETNGTIPDVFVAGGVTFKYNTDRTKVVTDVYDGTASKCSQDYEYVLIDSIEFPQGVDRMSVLKKTLTSKEFGRRIRNTVNNVTDKEIQVCFVLKGQENQSTVKMMSNLSDEIGGVIHWETEDINKGIFVYNLETNINEALDIDNLFWTLDTWFGNNENERNSFLSLVDNCVIKKTYSKNDLAKLCETINFDIRPFVNFMCRDVHLEKGQTEDSKIDYWYELKQILDAIISNKSVSNKYVRFA